MRCVACNVVLKDWEIYINPKSLKFEDCCGRCRGAAFNTNTYSVQTEGNELVTEILDKLGERWT